MNTRKSLTGLVVLALSVFLAVPTFAQNRTSFAGLKNAFDFAYGVNPNVSPLVIGIGNTATGSQTITLQFGNVTLSDGTVLMPLATTAPITVGLGSNAETVTPSAVSCSTPTVYNSCTVTATFANTHGQGEPVSSGTFGVAEAVNAAHAIGGGLVAFDAKWAAAGGATTQFASKTYGWANVTLLDWRGTGNGTTLGVSWRASNGGAYAIPGTPVPLY